MIGIAKVFETGQSKSKTVVIPKDIAEATGIQAGDKLLVTIKGKELRLKKVE